MNPVTFAADSPQTPEIAAILDRHHALMRSQSPAESCHVKTPRELLDAGGKLFAVRAEGQAVAVGAMTALEPGHWELKSMHVVAEARGTGLGRVLLDGMIGAAREMGATRLSLETGSGADHDAARALYRAFGFDDCPPFGDYRVDPLSTYMTRTL